MNTLQLVKPLPSGEEGKLRFKLSQLKKRKLYVSAKVRILNKWKAKYRHSFNLQHLIDQELQVLVTRYCLIWQMMKFCWKNPLNRPRFTRHLWALQWSSKEVPMSGKRYTEEFKIEAVRQLTEGVTPLVRLRRGSASQPKVFTTGGLNMVSHLVATKKSRQTRTSWDVWEQNSSGWRRSATS